MAGRNHTYACHTAEDRHPYPSPVVTKVTRMHLSAKDCQDQRQHRQQVHLSPKLQDGRVTDTTDIILISEECNVISWLCKSHNIFLRTNMLIVSSYQKLVTLQHYSRRRRRSQEHNSPECQQRCLRSPARASGGMSSLTGGMRTGDTPLSTTCTPGMNTYTQYTYTTM